MIDTQHTQRTASLPGFDLKTGLLPLHLDLNISARQSNILFALPDATVVLPLASYFFQTILKLTKAQKPSLAPVNRYYNKNTQQSLVAHYVILRSARERTAETNTFISRTINEPLDLHTIAKIRSKNDDTTWKER